MSANNAAYARELKEKAVQTLSVAKDRVVEGSKVAGRKIDAKAHEKPWYFVGVAAFFSVVLGFFLGRKTKH
jgi:ElaB/YqjD/DUF883 family membrane-anchored ribosome-binding protein